MCRKTIDFTKEQYNELFRCTVAPELSDLPVCKPEDAGDVFGFIDADTGFVRVFERGCAY